MLLGRSSRRYLLRHPWLALLSIVGVALGVSLVVAIDLASASAERAFRLSAEGVTGRATHAVVSGMPGGVPDAVYRMLRVELGVEDAAPVVEGYARAASDSGRTLQLLGVDLLAEAPFRPYLGDAQVDLSRFMAQPRTALLAAPTADALGLRPGDSLRLDIEGVPSAVQVVGLIEPAGDRARAALDNLLVMDVSTAQELLAAQGRLSRIDLLAEDDEAMLARVRAALPPGLSVERSTSRTETVEQMTRAFDLNLRALSLLALVVGMFLIYNTMTFSVVQRRQLIGRLRALGVTRREVFRLIAGEALLIGVVGTALGLLLGFVLAQGLVRLVTQTINDLYYVVSVRGVTVSAWVLAKGALMGLGATLLAALPPAREATQAAPSAVLRRSQEESRVVAALPKLASAGVLLGLMALGLLALPTRSIAVSYAALLCVIVGFALLVPGAVALAAKALRPVAGRVFGVIGRMAARGLTTTLSRTGVAVAALSVAVAATVGVGVMVDSFRQTVDVWLGYALSSDVYVQPPSMVFRRGDATLSPEVVRLVTTAPGVGGVHSVRNVRVETEEAGRVDLSVVDPSPMTPQSTRIKEGDAQRFWRDFGEAQMVAVSEPFSYRHGVAAGDTLTLATPEGPARFPVRVVFYDYASDLGVVMMHRATYDQFFDDPGLSGIGLTAAPGVEVDALVERLRERVAGEQAVTIRSNRGLREASLAIFDRTFTVTVVLRLLAVVVAFIGVLSALMALQLERSREFAVLRASGMTPGQLGRYVTLQTGLMGLVAGLLAVPLGLVLALVLVYVINRRSFGWTLQFDLAPELLVQAVVLALLAALLAGLYPGWKMARANPAEALREE